MSITSLSSLLEFLNDIEASPLKSLSQNFLIDKNITKKIIALAELQKNDVVLEIGPGPGALTEEILKTGCKVIAVEKDKKFAKYLTRLNGDISVFCEDVLSKGFLEKIIKFKNKIKVISNLPYNISTPVLKALFNINYKIDSMVLMFQKDFFDRLSADIKTKKYGSLTIFFNFYAEVLKHFVVSENCFFPKPKIKSCVSLIKMKEPLINVDDNFFDITRLAFSKRRKFLFKNLSAMINEDILKIVINKLNIDEKSRAEDLSIEDYLNLYSLLREYI